MRGYAGRFIRVTMKNGEYLQGGSNHGIIMTEEDDRIVIRAKQDYHLINGRNSREMINESIGEIDTIQIDLLDNENHPFPDCDIVFRQELNKNKRRRYIYSPDRDPIQTSAVVGGNTNVD